jgi:hypothetical protein
MVQLFLSWMWFWYYSCSTIYNDERKFWPPFHPVLVSDGLLAVSTIVAYGRLLSLFQLNRKFGPMQVNFANSPNFHMLDILCLGVNFKNVWRRGAVLAHLLCGHPFVFCW